MLTVFYKLFQCRLGKCNARLEVFGHRQPGTTLPKNLSMLHIVPTGQYVQMWECPFQQ
jgi:hypothetical protein